MPTAPVTTPVAGSSFSVNVTLANLDSDNTLSDYLVLENGVLSLNPGSYTKTAAGSTIVYSGVTLPATALEVRRRTPRLIRVAQSVGTKIRSTDWNNEFDRLIRIAEEYDVYGAGGGFSVRLPLDGAFGAAWDGDTLFPPTRNAVYDQVVLKANSNSPAFTGTPSAPTALTADNSTTIANTAHVKANLSSYAPLASPAFAGVPTAPTPLTPDNSTAIATTSHVKANLASYTLLTTLSSYLTASLAGSTYAPIISPVLTGTPTAPAIPNGNKTNQLVTALALQRSHQPIVIANSTTTFTLPAGTFVDLPYGNVVTDSMSAYNGGTGVFTAPYTGVYNIGGSISSQPSTLLALGLFDTSNVEIARISTPLSSTAGFLQASGSVTVLLNAGAAVKLRALSSIATTSNAAPTVQYLSFQYAGIATTL